MITLTKDNIKDVEYSVGCVSKEELPKLLESLLEEVDRINEMTKDLNGDLDSPISIAWENEHTEYSPERTDPCPDNYGFFYIAKDVTTVGDAMSIDQLDESLCLLDDFVEIDWMNHRYAKTELMSLDEAIKHCNEVAESIAASGCEECAKEHKQLADWLTELKEYRENRENK